jgi:CDP-diacylglycerol--serine O-phosphatidyltransferase
MLIYMWSLNSLKSLGWLVALGLAICCALRLARFNVAIDDPDKPAWTMNFFTGAPAPAGAGLAMAPMYLGFLGLIRDGHDYSWFVLPYIAAVALLMVSRVPTFSGKTLGGRISRDLVLPILGIAALFIVSLIAFTWHVLTAMSLLYIAMLPVGIRSYSRHKAEGEKRARAAEMEGESA